MKQYTGMLGCWDAGMLECWNKTECWDAGINHNAGMKKQECWNAGMFTCGTGVPFGVIHCHGDNGGCV